MPKNRFEFKVLAHKIAEFKKKNKLTFEDIGKATDVNRSHIHRIINREHFPSLKFLFRLATFMNVPLYSLFIPTKEMIHQDFIEKINTRLNELSWDYEELSERAEISLSQIMDIVEGNTSISKEDQDKITNILKLENITDHQNSKINLMKYIINADLTDDQIANIIKNLNENINS
ncbi:MAG: helix-turn-helix transcriptional regulator [Halanaerobiales bacterium]|nr:helix-turn-helix transcriptional regulator [Halanaerobiales bacterium]